MAPPRRALISITSASAKIYNGKETTGLFVTEALHPFKVLTEAGFEVDLASETGSYAVDSFSLTPDFLKGEDREIWEDTNSAFRKKIDNMSKASELDGSKYGVFYASAGHASVIDYPTAKGLQDIATKVWTNGGIVSTVCHGPAIFAGLIDPATKEPLIKGKRITGFTTEGEEQLGAVEDIRKWKAELVDELAERLGAKYERAPGPWDDFHVVDGRIITGQNPASATSTAKAVVNAFEKL